MKKNFLPYNSQQLDKSDIKSVMKALKSPYLTTGPIADEFEKELAKYTKQNIYGDKIVIGMGAGTISNWMRNLPKLVK